MILIIDNYDSFTYNLVQAIGGLGIDRDIKVVRNDEAAIDEIQAWNPTHIVISPGPCTPNESGISCDVIRRFAGRVPILGVCLGHQCIGQVFGGKVVRAERLMHGKTSPIHHIGTGIYDGLSNPFTATRYHSLTVDESTIPPDFEKTAWTDHGELMGIRHESMRLEGVQFHPESYLTTEGSRLIANFLRL
ncbi:MAG: aminodeoxychorismate/anthranilate synthase component II [Phycisphaerales bacterium]|nr:aminodeoxychorismate/anthranilate synthase component II [Phycisphaerales bacterium]